MSHFGWTWRYLHWGVRWPQVQKMMLDAPWYEYDTDDGGDKKVTTKQQAKRLTSQNADQIAAFINNLQA